MRFRANECASAKLLIFPLRKSAQLNEHDRYYSIFIWFSHFHFNKWHNRKAMISTGLQLLHGKGELRLIAIVELNILDKTLSFLFNSILIEAKLLNFCFQQKKNDVRNELASVVNGIRRKKFVKIVNWNWIEWIFLIFFGFIWKPK